MDKLKNLISPGHAQDDETLYGTQGTTGSPSTATTGQGHVNPATGGVSSNTSEFQDIGSDAKALSGSTHMPGGFEATLQEDSTRRLGHPSSTKPATASTGHSATATHPSTAASVPGVGGLGSTAAHDSRVPHASGVSTGTSSATDPLASRPGHTSGTHPTASGSGVPSTRNAPAYSAAAPHGSTAADDGISNTSVKSGVLGNTATRSSAPSGAGASSTSTAVPGTHSTPTSTQHATGLSQRDPYATTSTGLGGSTVAPGNTTGRPSGVVEDPPFSNRTLHNPTSHSTTSGSHGREALAGAAAAGTGYEASKHHGPHNHGTHHGPHHGTYGVNPATTSASGASLQPSYTGTDGAGSQPRMTGGTGTATHPSIGGTTSATHPLSGASGTHSTTGTTGGTSTLSDRTRPHADVRETVTDRSFPLGGHAGEGPHPVSTANRLNPVVPDSAAEFRDGTHHHGQHHHGGTAATPASGLTGSTASPYGTESTRATSGTSVPFGTTTGTGATGLGATGAHHSGTTGSAPTMTSGGVSQPAGHTYNTLSDGTPSGISARDPAHSSTLPGQGTSTSSSHGPGHLGRDAALGAGAVGIGSEIGHEAAGHHRAGHSGEPTRSTAISGGVGLPTGHTHDNLSHGTTSGVSAREPAHSSAVPSHGASTTGTHGSGHLGRDAALGAGAAGVGSGAAYEASRHHGSGHSTEPTKATMTSGGVGKPAGHTYNTLSDGTPSGIAHTDPAHPQQVSQTHGTTSTLKDPSSTTGHGTSGHHIGRDVGIAGAGAGATGLAAHEHGKHTGHPTAGSGIERAAEDRSAGGALNHRPIPGYEGPQSIPGERGVGPSTTSTAASRAQESLSRHPEQTSGHHTGRDTAAIGGVGGAGTAAAYEAEKHKHGHQAPTSSSTAAPAGYNTSRHVEPTSSHPGHAGRDVAAGTGATGTGTAAAAYEAEKHRHGKEGHPTSSQTSKDQAYVERHPELAPGHRDHTGRDVATGAGVGGAGTAAAYEAEKHSHGKSTTSDVTKSDSKHDGTSPDEKKPGLLDKILHPNKSKEEERRIEEEKRSDYSTATTTGAPAFDSKHHDTAHGAIPTKTENISPSDKHHYGQQAAVGGAGATGLGSQAQVDPRHSKERTAAMPGSGVHGTEPRAATGVAGASQPGAYEGAQAAAERHGYGGQTTATHPTQSAHHPHTGRDAALAGTRTAGVGGAGLAAHEHGHSSSVPYSVGDSRYQGNTGSTQTPSSSAVSPVSTAGHGQRGIDPRVDSPQYGSTSASGTNTQVPRYDGAGYPPTSSTKGHTSRLQEDPVMVGNTTASGTRNAPGYAGDSLGSEHSGEKSGGLSGLLHRDNPNKLHKDPPTH